MKDGKMTIRVVKFRQSYANGKAVDEVLIAPSGESFMKTQTWYRVDKLRPPEHIEERDMSSIHTLAMVSRWSVIGPAYDAWRSGTEVPETGTPLAAWAGVSADQVEILKSMAIRTVEDVRDMSEGVFTRLPFPNARQLPKLAKDYLDGADVASKDAKMAEMQERMDAMAEMLEKATAPAPKKNKEAA